jgi:type III pantothenate kinase
VLLAIDVGNTNIVIGLYNSEKLTTSWRIKTDTRSTADELSMIFRNLLIDQPEITGIALCSTVPAVLTEMRKMLESKFAAVKTVIIEPGVKTGVPILIDNPKEVGADRIANSLAVFNRHGGPSVVVDFGTSTNFDVVSAQGEFLGGALAPGIEISLDALANRAAQLRKVELTKPRSVIGKGTVEALQSGALFGFAGQVDGIVNRIKKEVGELTAVVATGGLAEIVVSESETITHHEPDLTLEGLRLVFEKNR